MHRTRIHRRLACVAVTLMIVLGCTLVGCSSGFTTIAPIPPKKYEKLGPAKGQATGVLGMFLPAYSFVPMRLNSRVERAYADAVQSVPGSTGLMDVTYQESWFWFFFGTAWTVTISGEAIRELPE